MSDRTKSSQRTLAVDAELWEQYRLYQRDVLLGCIQDADIMVRRMKSENADADKRMLVGLLWDKRCQPWKYFRDEHLALVRR